MRVAVTFNSSRDDGTNRGRSGFVGSGVDVRGDVGAPELVLACHTSYGRKGYW
jgi:hypothetical protein